MAQMYKPVVNLVGRAATIQVRTGNSARKLLKSISLIDKLDETTSGVVVKEERLTTNFFSDDDHFEGGVSVTIPDNLKKSPSSSDLIEPLHLPEISSDTMKLLVEGSAQENPWELFKSINAFLKRFVFSRDERYFDVMSLFVILSYFREVFTTLGIIFLNGQKGSGKSTVEEVAGSLCLNSVVSSSVTEAVLGYLIHTSQVTVAVDEAEFLGFGTVADALKRLLRDTHRANGRRIFKVKGGHDVQCVFAPMMIANISGMKDRALYDRCITVQTVKAESEIEHFDCRFVAEDVSRLKERLVVLWLLFAQEVADIYRDTKEIPGLTHRAFDIWAPLYVLGKFVDSHSKKKGHVASRIAELAVESTRQREAEGLATDEEYQVLNGLYLYLASRKKFVGFLWENVHIKDFYPFLKKEFEVEMGKNTVGKILKASGVVKRTARAYLYTYKQKKDKFASNCYVIDVDALVEKAKAMGIATIDAIEPPPGKEGGGMGILVDAGIESIEVGDEAGKEGGTWEV